MRSHMVCHIVCKPFIVCANNLANIIMFRKLFGYLANYFSRRNLLRAGDRNVRRGREALVYQVIFFEPWNHYRLAWRKSKCKSKLAGGTFRVEYPYTKGTVTCTSWAHACFYGHVTGNSILYMYYTNTSNHKNTNMYTYSTAESLTWIVRNFYQAKSASWLRRFILSTRWRRKMSARGGKASNPPLMRSWLETNGRISS